MFCADAAKAGTANAEVGHVEVDNAANDEAFKPPLLLLSCRSYRNTISTQLTNTHFVFFWHQACKSQTFAIELFAETQASKIQGFAKEKATLARRQGLAGYIFGSCAVLFWQHCDG